MVQELTSVKCEDLRNYFFIDENATEMSSTLITFGPHDVDDERRNHIFDSHQLLAFTINTILS